MDFKNNIDLEIENASSLALHFMKVKAMYSKMLETEEYKDMSFPKALPLIEGHLEELRETLRRIAEKDGYGFVRAVPGGPFYFAVCVEEENVAEKCRAHALLPEACKKHNLDIEKIEEIIMLKEIEIKHERH